MKLLLIAGILVLASVGSASAQSLAGVPGVGGSSINNSGSLSSGRSINTSSVGGSVSPSRSYINVEAKNPGEFVPSTFEDYNVALDQGENARRVRPLTIVEAAHMAQQAKAAAAGKPAIVLEKNAEGNLITVSAKDQPSAPAKQ
jgi:hypothetical protein